MHDGPCRTLPLAKFWRQTASLLEDPNYDVAPFDFRDRFENALHRDWEKLGTEKGLKKVQSMMARAENDLFNDELLDYLEQLKDCSESQLSRILAGHFLFYYKNGKNISNRTVEKAVSSTLMEWRDRQVRHIQRHYMKAEHFKHRTLVLERLQAFRGKDITDALVNKIVHGRGAEARPRFGKQDGIDDGVMLGNQKLNGY